MLLLIEILLLLCSVGTQGESNMRLILVQAMWRHGDRSPTTTFKSDPYQEGNWTFGGGGFGQLSPIGMKQQMDLGKLLRKIYVLDNKFISPQYSSKEVYVRATDTNRTIVSALSNLVGMFGQQDIEHKPDVDFPSVPGWPPGFVPVAVHTIHKPTDYVGHPDADCNRRSELWKMAMNSAELQEYKNRKDIVEVLEFLKEKCGQTIVVDNMGIVRDPLYIEQIYFNDTIRKSIPWFNDALFEKINEMFGETEHYKYGLFKNEFLVNGVNVGYELKKVRGGPFFNEISDRMDSKLNCMNSNESSCKWINGLKYYAYSVHDSTLYQFFVLLGIAERVVTTSPLPEYAAAATVELWIDEANKPYFRLMYRADEYSNLYSITKEVDGCDGKEYCDLNVFRAVATKFRPEKPMPEFCEMIPEKKSNGVAELICLTSIIEICGGPLPASASAVKACLHRLYPGSNIVFHVQFNEKNFISNID